MTNEAGRTLAHVAADYNHVAILKALKAQGANMNVRSVHLWLYFAYLLLEKATDKHGITPLLAAVWEGHKAAVEFLLSAGAGTPSQRSCSSWRRFLTRRRAW